MLEAREAEARDPVGRAAQHPTRGPERDRHPFIGPRSGNANPAQEERVEAESSAPRRGGLDGGWATVLILRRGRS